MSVLFAVARASISNVLRYQANCSRPADLHRELNMEIMKVSAGWSNGLLLQTATVGYAV
jgi:hypothetical protein